MAATKNRSVRHCRTHGNKVFEVAFSQFAPPVSEQLRQQGFALDPKVAEEVDKDAAAVMRLRLRQIIAVPTAQRAESRILRLLDDEAVSVIAPEKEGA